MDSSSGWLSDVVWRTQDVIREICFETPRESDDAQYIFTHGQKDFCHKDFEGWDEYSYTMLCSVAQLANSDNFQKIEATLNSFTDKNTARHKASGNSWALDGPNIDDMLVRAEIMRAKDGEDASMAYIYQNIDNFRFREMAIRKMIQKHDFAEAELLALNDRLLTRKKSVSSIFCPNGHTSYSISTKLLVTWTSKQ